MDFYLSVSNDAFKNILKQETGEDSTEAYIREWGKIRNTPPSGYLCVYRLRVYAHNTL